MWIPWRQIKILTNISYFSHEIFTYEKIKGVLPSPAPHTTTILFLPGVPNINTRSQGDLSELGSLVKIAALDKSRIRVEPKFKKAKFQFVQDGSSMKCFLQRIPFQWEGFWFFCNLMVKKNLTEKFLSHANLWEWVKLLIYTCVV